MDLKFIIVSSLIILLLDYIYLSFTKNSFINMVVNIQKSEFKVNHIGVIISYTLLIIANYYFIYKKKYNYTDSFILGIIIYGVFDATNLAIFKDYNIKLGIMDTLWGGSLMVMTNYLTNKVITL